MKKYHSISLLLPNWLRRLLSIAAHLLTFSAASVLLFLLGFYVIPAFAEKVPAMTESIAQLTQKKLPGQMTITDVTDSDSDGLPDELELRFGSEIMLSDTDGDGVPDGIEVGHNYYTPLDTDGDGRLNLLDEDDDGDGIPSIIEGTDDTDGDGVANFLDQDSDADGISDRHEAGLSLLDADADRVDDKFDADITGGEDANGDGIDDSAVLADIDQNGVADFLEKTTSALAKLVLSDDSDNDGIPDIAEIGQDINHPQDSDRDGIIDRLDNDDDNDGILTRLEDVDGDGSPLNDDTDNDGVPNYQDANDDGDTRLTKLEGATADSDNDGIPDYLDRDEAVSNTSPKVVVLYQEAPAPASSKPTFNLAVTD